MSGVPGAAKFFMGVLSIQSVHMLPINYLGRKTMDRHISKFLTYLEVEKNASTHTIASYLMDLKQARNFLENKDVQKIERLDVRKYLAHLKGKNLKKRSVARKRHRANRCR